MTSEQKHRAMIEWFVAEAMLRIPVALQRSEGWKWDDDNEQLFAMTDYGEVRFHVARSSGRIKVRHAVFSVTDNYGKATWEVNIPNDVWESSCAAAQ